MAKNSTNVGGDWWDYVMCGLRRCEAVKDRNRPISKARVAKCGEGGSCSVRHGQRPPRPGALREKQAGAYAPVMELRPQARRLADMVLEKQRVEFCILCAHQLVRGDE